MTMPPRPRNYRQAHRPIRWSVIVQCVVIAALLVAIVVTLAERRREELLRMNEPTPISLTAAVGPEVTPAPVAQVSLSQGRTGVIAYADESFPSNYLAIPIGPGHLVRICGPAACWTTTSTEAGPNHDMLVIGRIADVAVGQWERICGASRIEGTCSGSWHVVGRGTLPPTDT